MLTWRYGIVIDGSRFVRWARQTGAGQVPGHQPVFAAANPDAGAYETEVQGMLAEIETRGAGRAIYMELAATERTVRILPLTAAAVLRRRKPPPTTCGAARSPARRWSVREPSSRCG